jgi:hypothetical protein
MAAGTSLGPGLEAVSAPESPAEPEAETEWPPGPLREAVRS